MEHMLERTEMLLDVSLDDLHLLFGVDLGNAGFFILGRFAVRVIFAFILRAAGFPGDFSGSSVLRAGGPDRRGCG